MNSSCGESFASPLQDCGFWMESRILGGRTVGGSGGLSPTSRTGVRSLRFQIRRQIVIFKPQDLSCRIPELFISQWISSAAATLAEL